MPSRSAPTWNMLPLCRRIPACLCLDWTAELPRPRKSPRLGPAVDVFHHDPGALLLDEAIRGLLGERLILIDHNQHQVSIRQSSMDFWIRCFRLIKGSADASVSTFHRNSADGHGFTHQVAVVPG